MYKIAEALILFSSALGRKHQALQCLGLQLITTSTGLFCLLSIASTDRQGKCSVCFRRFWEKTMLCLSDLGNSSPHIDLVQRHCFEQGQHETPKRLRFLLHVVWQVQATLSPWLEVVSSGTLFLVAVLVHPSAYDISIFHLPIFSQKQRHKIVHSIVFLVDQRTKKPKCYQHVFSCIHVCRT